MYPHVYISNEFFDIFDNCEKEQGSFSVYSDTDGQAFETRRRIVFLLSSSNISTNLKDRNLKQYFSTFNGTYKNLKELVFQKLIKDHGLPNPRVLTSDVDMQQCKNASYCYFIGDTAVNCEGMSKRKGKVVIGREFLQRHFFPDCTFPVEHVNPELSDDQLKRINHPCSGILVIDKYVFDDRRERPQKISNLIRLLKSFMTSELEGPLEVDIITQHTENNNLIQKQIEEIKKTFSEKISLHVYAPARLNESDRFLITNYAVISIQHPLDRPSVISSNFYPSNLSGHSIVNAYKLWSDKVRWAKGVVTGTPKSIGQLRFRWLSDDLKHKLFDDL